VNLKLDENIGRRAARLLAAEGHDVATVRGQDLGALLKYQLLVYIGS